MEEQASQGLHEKSPPNYDLMPLTDIPLETIYTQGMPGLYLLGAEDREKPSIDGEIETISIVYIRRIQDLLQDPDIGREFSGLAMRLSEITLDDVEQTINKYNSAIEKNEEVIPDDSFLRQTYAINSVLMSFYRESLVKDPDQKIDSAISELHKTYNLTGLDENIIKPIEKDVRNNPWLLLSPSRFGESGGILKEADSRPIKIVDKEPFKSQEGAIKIEKIRAVRESLTLWLDQERNDLSPELCKLIECVMGRMLGNDNLRQLIKEYAADPIDYCRKKTGKKTPTRGLKIHIPFDFRNSEALQILNVVANIAATQEVSMKVQRLFSSYNRHNKGITIYPPLDDENAEINGVYNNPDNTFQLIRTLDQALLKYKQKKPTPYKTDLPLGTSNMINVRYGTLNKEEVTYPDEWVDSRERTFDQNFPNPQVLQSFMDQARQEGLVST